jgi:hypothetical protein
METIISHDHFQKAYEEVTMEWWRKLYSFRPEQLPDMAVFVAELKEMNMIAELIYSYAKQVRPLLAKRHKLLVALKDIDRRILIGQRKTTEDDKGYKIVLKRLKAEELIKLKNERVTLRKALTDLSNLILSWRFGLMAPMRDLTKIVASFYDYWETLKYQPTHEHIRRIGGFSLPITAEYVFKQGCSTNPSCGFGTPSVGDVFDQVTRDIRFILTCNVEFRNTLLGSDIEQMGYALLSQLGLVPDIMSLWEMKRLSWFLDYFVRLQSYLIKTSVKAGLGFQKPVVYRSAISLKVVQTVQYHGDNCPRWALWHANTPLRWTHYERICNTAPVDLTHLVKLVHSPSFNQGVNAAALVFQTLL